MSYLQCYFIAVINLPVLWVQVSTGRLRQLLLLGIRVSITITRRYTYTQYSMCTPAAVGCQIGLSCKMDSMAWSQAFRAVERRYDTGILLRTCDILDPQDADSNEQATSTHLR